MSALPGTDAMTVSAATNHSLDDTGVRLIYAIGGFDTAVRSALKCRLEPLGLTITEFTTLSVLSVRNGLSNAQLARRSLVTPQAMNQVLASLEGKGLIERGQAPGRRSGGGHHRARSTELTAKGRLQVQQCTSIVDEIEDASFSPSSGAERVALAAMLRDATQRLRARLLDEGQS
jgi:DNA-binding MarR family transcriptional regulator